ncbi:glycerate kinase-like [Rhagoletis pomonella]|uniref:glycerate kinase-like n=1 Tax=Rhagoletis pomonella TaxID=28610 RepID=UPI0017856B21|nr:glycerate kinase-like [Rhagoletis pomonella]XP_036328313.1 glycerate kinase-like [Rhagoletis pomonella]
MSAKLQHIQNLRHIFQRSAESVRPAQLLSETNQYILRPQPSEDGRRLSIQIQGKTLDITRKHCHVVGFGKAVLGMAVQLEKSLGNRLVSGVLSIPVGTRQRFRDVPEMQLPTNSIIEIFEGAPNNQPDEQALQAAQRIKALAANMTENDILFVLISGGGSALLPLPRTSLKLSEKMQLVRRLANCGASIDEMNVLRIALSDIKGGRLAAAARNAFAVVSFVISDVVGDPVDIIASGPTCCALAKRLSAKEVLEKYELFADLPEHIRVLVEQPEVKAEMEPARNNYIYMVGDNRVATAQAVQEALQCGYNPFIASTTVEGEVQELVSQYKDFLQDLCSFRKGALDEHELKKRFPFDARIFQHFLKTLLMCERTKKPLLLILAGEPTVKVTGTGLGGRNQELALRLALALYENADFENVIFLSAGTDGIDGPTPAAGAIGCDLVISDFLKNTSMSLNNVQAYLQNSDSYNFYKNLNGGEYHVLTGHTGTNVMDLQFLLIA